jgi:hypothetical protein
VPRAATDDCAPFRDIHTSGSEAMLFAGAATRSALTCPFRIRRCGFAEPTIRTGRSIFSFAMSKMRTTQTFDQQFSGTVGAPPSPAP